MIYEPYVYLISALLPLTAGLLLLQVNPYHALVVRGVLGAVAALIYALFGAADVSLTEALVGTLLTITLYAVAVRSSLVMRIGILTTDLSAPQQDHLNPLTTRIQAALRKYHVRLEWMAFTQSDDLVQALQKGEVHGIYDLSPSLAHVPPLSAQRVSGTDAENLKVRLLVRVQRLYTIIQEEVGIDAVRPLDFELTLLEDGRP